VTQRIIVGKSGASGAIPGIPAPKAPRASGVDAHQDAGLQSRTRAAGTGAMIAPFVPAWYARSPSIDGIVNPAVGRVLDQFDPDHFDIDTGAVNRGGEHVPANDNA